MISPLTHLLLALLLSFSPVAFTTSNVGVTRSEVEDDAHSMMQRTLLEKENITTLSHWAKPVHGGQGKCRTILEIVLAHPSLFSTLATAVGVVPGLADVLDDPEAEITLFAPTNNAFTRAFDTYVPLPIEEFLELPQAVEQTLLYHAVGEAFYTPQLPDTLTTLQGETISVTRNKFHIMLDPFVPESVHIVGPNIPACKSVIQVIDLVMVPESVANLF
eukprot:scaffold270_cov347-Pavlova_lutheri.AAC.19